MAKTNMIRINPLKLRREFDKRGLSMRDVAVELGYGADYFHNCCNRLRLSKMAALSLQMKHDIRPDEYEATDTKPEAEPVTEPEHPPRSSV